MGQIVTAPEVKAWADLTTVADTIVDDVIDAVEATLVRDYVLPDDLSTIDPGTRLAVMRQCQQLLAQRPAPHGVVPGFEAGAIRFSRFDPQFADLIGVPRKPACA